MPTQATPYITQLSTCFLTLTIYVTMWTNISAECSNKYQAHILPTHIFMNMYQMLGRSHNLSYKLWCYVITRLIWITSWKQISKMQYSIIVIAVAVAALIFMEVQSKPTMRKEHGWGKRYVNTDINMHYFIPEQIWIMFK